MLGRSHRFHGRNSLQFVYRHGQVVRGQLLSLRFVLNTRRQDYRMAVVVGRKVHKSAVKRNRIRRRLYEIVREHQTAIAQPYDLVFTIHSEQVATMPDAQLQQLLLTQLKRANVLS